MLFAAPMARLFVNLTPQMGLSMIRHLTCSDAAVLLLALPCCAAAVTTSQFAYGEFVYKPKPTVIITDNSAFGSVSTSAFSTNGQPATASSYVCAGTGCK
jgi:hypothetical protein